MGHKADNNTADNTADTADNMELDNDVDDMDDGEYSLAGDKSTQQKLAK